MLSDRTKFYMATALFAGWILTLGVIAAVSAKKPQTLTAPSAEAKSN